jgi:dihydroflavonol-4-reductase
MQRLLEGGWRVRALVEPGTEEHAPSGPGIECVTGDLADADAVADCVARADVVYHLAGVMPGPSQPDLAQVNVRGTRMVAEMAAMHAARQLVFLSSAAVYRALPPARWPIGEDAPLRDWPRGPGTERSPLNGFLASMNEYAWTKRQGERILRHLHARHSVPSCTVRSTEAYGPWRRWFAGFVEQARRRPSLLFAPRASVPSLQWIHLDDLHDLLIRAGSHELSGPLVVNAAGPELFSARDIGRLAVPEVRLPPARQAPTLKYSVAWAARVFGWVPTVRLAEGMRDLLDVEASWC